MLNAEAMTGPIGDDPAVASTQGKGVIACCGFVQRPDKDLYGAGRTYILGSLP